MTDFWRWLKDHLGFVLISILLVLFSPIFTDILPDKQTSGIAKVLLVGGNVLLAVYAGVSEVRRNAAQRQLSNEQSVWTAKLLQDRLAVSHRAIVLESVVNRCSEVVAELRVSIEAIRLTPQVAPEQVASARQTCVKAILRALCLVLESDHPLDADPLKAVYFKATFFEFEPIAGREGNLRRAYWHYPDTIHPQTIFWSIDDDANAAAVIAFKTQREVILPSVAKAAVSGSQWKDSRAGQRQEYEQSSMVCIPVFTDVRDPRAPKNTVMGILTVDTNQLDYFQVGENNRALRSEVFGPFLGLIRLAYGVTNGPKA
jgi:hypothetical protein